MNFALLVGLHIFGLGKRLKFPLWSNKLLIFLNVPQEFGKNICFLFVVFRISYAYFQGY